MSKQKPSARTSPTTDRQRRKPSAGSPAQKRVSRRRMGQWALAVLVLAAAGGGLFVAVRRGRPPARAAAPAAAAPTLLPAEQALRAALAAHPNDPASHAGLAAYLLDAHRPFEALWQFRALQDLQPDNPDARAGIARSLIHAGLPAAGIRVLSTSTSRTPNTKHRTPSRSTSTSDRSEPNTEHATRDTASARAEAALATGRPAEAIRVLAAVGRALAGSAPAQRLLGDARAAAGDATGAAAAYRRAAALEPDSAASFDRLGRLALAAGHWNAAQSALTTACQRSPREPGSLYRLGRAVAGAGQWDQAEHLWQEAALLSPAYAPAQAALGKLYADRQQWSLALPRLVAAVKLAPSSREAELALAAVLLARGERASAFYQRGFYDLETDQPHRALAEFRRMAAAAPERVDGPLAISLACIQMKRLDLAVAAAQQGLDRHPGDASLLLRLAQLHTMSHNWPRVRQLCQEWLQRDPHAAEPYTVLEQIAREEQRLPEARRDGERALALDPANAAACFQMSQTLSVVPSPANQRRALALARQAAALNPGQAEYWHQLGVLLRGAGRLEEAASAFLHSLDLNPAAVESCRLLVSIAAQEQRPATARFLARLVTDLEERARTGDALWRAVYRRPEDAAAHAHLARYLLADGDLQHACFQLQQVATLRPADAAARRDLAIVERLLALREE